MSNPTLYYTNAGGDSNWETLTNWNTAADGSGDNPTNIPWTDDGNGGAWYADTDLVDATSGAGITINSVIDPNGVVTGNCDIVSITNIGGIYGGTFTGSGFTNYYSLIYGGTFFGDNFTNNGFIYGGTFTGNYFSNNNIIYGGTFTGDGFTNNNAIISGGTFTGSGFTNYYSLIYGGTFFGDNFTNNGYIYGGTFTGDNFTNNNIIYGGIFGGTFPCGDRCECGFQSYDSCGACGSGCWGNQCDCGCDFYDSCGACGSGCLGNGCDCGCLYDYGCGCGVTCPPSGDGEDNNLIYRLVGLPWFVRSGNPDLASQIGLPPFIKL